MQFVVYADESGTDNITQKGAGPSVGGWIATAEYWTRFCGEWRAVLNRYKAPYFHFRELNPSERKKRGNPYFGWRNDHADDFIHDLAIIAGREAVPFGGNVHLAKPEHPNHRRDPWRQAFERCFDDFMEAMTQHWPECNDRVHFFFDRQENDDRIKELSGAIKAYQEKDARIGGYTFGDMKIIRPLQAADMLVYAQRQVAERAFKTQTVQPQRILDLILYKNLRPVGHPHGPIPFMNLSSWELLMREFRKDKKRWLAERKTAGFPKTEYYPAIHFGHPGNLIGR